MMGNVLKRDLEKSPDVCACVFVCTLKFREIQASVS